MKSLRAKPRAFLFTAGVATLLSVTGVCALNQYFPPDLNPADFATVVVDRHGNPLRQFADSSGTWRHEIAQSEVSPLYLQALMGYEDRWFHAHPGVNPFALARAAWDAIRLGRIVSGGSTLTMQVARLRYRYPRTGVGKIQQMARALQLEWHYEKDALLTYYLNHAPFGGPIEGVQAASLRYFGYPASLLTHGQAALLAVIPQAPSRYRPDRYPQAAQRARDKVLDRLAAYGVWPELVTNDSKLESVIPARPDEPLHAPLLARRLKSKGPRAVVQTFIDVDLQVQVARLVRSHAALAGHRTSAAALVMEHTTGEVLAYVGSASFAAQQRFGYVDMVSARRSPGSTFKPVVYGLALDQGLIHSASLLHDTPLRFGNYVPDNFHRRFRGPVSASAALRDSLNVPAVQLLHRVGPQMMYARLANAGVSVHLPTYAAPNLSMALGGFSTTLEDLVMMFSAFGNHGRVVQPRLVPTTPFRSRALLSEQAAWIVADMLLAQDVGIPIKTGTSYAYQDVWAVGTNARYTIGVWVGRPDNKPAPGHSGTQTAVPLLARIHELLPRAQPHHPKPSGVSAVPVCWPLGRPAYLTESCDVRHDAWTIDGTVPATMTPGTGTLTATHLQLTATGLRAPLGCAADRSSSLVLWPEALEPWLPRSWHSAKRLPDRDPHCQGPDGLEPSSPIEIVGIDDGYRYRSHDPSRGAPTHLLRARGAATPWHWFVNGSPAGTTGGPLVLSLDRVETEVQITLLDRTGRAATVTLYNDGLFGQREYRSSQAR